jgi:hypothetical protein
MLCASGNDETLGNYESALLTSDKVDGWSNPGSGQIVGCIFAATSWLRGGAGGTIKMRKLMSLLAKRLALVWTLDSVGLTPDSTPIFPTNTSGRWR